MVESFAPNESMACSEYSDEDSGRSPFDLTETLLDHYLGPIRITGVTWCDLHGIISVALSDGSI